MDMLVTLAREEWRLWLRSRLALLVLVIFVMLLVVTSLVTAQRISAEQGHRLSAQANAEELFQTQPDRHPHRMVHYGHYVFRVPAPLAVFDPGIDRVAGQSIFLEGHRQNTPMFAEARASANANGLLALTPALVYQLLAPLLLIALGYACVVRERESGTIGSLLAQGVSGLHLMAGKALALFMVAGLLLIPAAVLIGRSVLQGESLALAVMLLGFYALYFLVWIALIMLVSMLSWQRSMSLAVLVLVWLVWALIVPRLGVAVSAATLPAPGHVETELVLQSELRAIGDGHDHRADQFAAIRQALLDEHGVDRVEDLPVNIRGVISDRAEEQLTDLLNEHAERRMAREQRQGQRLARFGWLSPVHGLGAVSRSLSGTDLNTHHRFMRQAEKLRFDFVQRLNEIHATELRYADDINRSIDAEAEQRTRVSADFWNLLDEFRFQPSPVAERLRSALPQGLSMLVWLSLLWAAVLFAARRLQP